MTELQEARLLGRAINHRWPVPDDYRKDVVESLYRIATQGVEDSARIAAAKALIAADSLNQKDEHKQQDDFVTRLIELAGRLGVEVSLDGAVQAIEGDAEKGNGQADSAGK